MGRSVREVSRRLGNLLKEARLARGWTLQQVSERLAEDGDAIPVSTLVRIEQGTRDPGASRLLRLLRLYDISPELASSAIEIEAEPVESLAKNETLDSLVKRGIEAWRSGEIQEALNRLRAARATEATTPGERKTRHEGLLALAGILRSLGRPRTAKQVIDELLLQPADAGVMVQALVIACSIWRALGVKEMALATIRQAARLLRPDEIRKFGWVLHQEAKVLLEFGDLRDAEQTLGHALRHYRRADDQEGELHALLLKIGVLDRRGRASAACKTSREVIERSAELGYPRLAVSARLELGRLQLDAGEIERALSNLGEGLGEAITLGDRTAQFIAHYYLWKSYEIAGDAIQANVSRTAAQQLVCFVEDLCPEAEEVRRMGRGAAAEPERDGSRALLERRRKRSV